MVTARGWTASQGVALATVVLAIPAALPARPLTPPSDSVTVGLEVLREYAGRYLLGASIADLKVIGDRLTVQLTNQPRYTIYASSPSEFFLTGVFAKITFTPGASGKVTEFVLEQNGRKLHALRIEKP